MRGSGRICRAEEGHKGVGDQVGDQVVKGGRG